ncbi:MAG: DNA-binding protein WhiA [Ruminococcaceae bacterium]|nr:DNA-binding protein WhiA [Oscillospiraceae bacterium]
MSFTEEIVNELYDFALNKTCCRKAFLCGLLYGALREEPSRQYKSFFYRLNDAECAAALIDAQFFTGVKTEIKQTNRGGHSGYTISFASKSLSLVLSDIDSRKKSITEAIGFRCEECQNRFLRGVFISSATVARPKSGYHVEFSIVGEARADALSQILEESVARPSRAKRSGRIGLYYKSNAKIADLLHVIGASNASYDLTNLSIERDIRNNENRATNCVTSNIKRTVGASMRYIEAIQYLEKTNNIALLGEELEYTARLRVEYFESSLSELAMIHNPPISKSGLNARLAKILAIADSVKEEIL